MLKKCMISVIVCICIACFMLCFFVYQYQCDINERYFTLCTENELLQTAYEELLTAQETSSEEPERSLMGYFTINERNEAVFLSANISVPNQNEFAFVFPFSENGTAEFSPSTRTTVYFLQEDGSVSTDFFYVETFSGTTYCQSTFQSLEGEESDILTLDEQTTVFIKTAYEQGVQRTSYRPSGSMVIITSVLESASLESTKHDAAIQEMVQSYYKKS